LAYVKSEADGHDLLIGKVQDSIDLLREYRTALISAAVTGKIDVRKEVF
jgi:type I restriction enzyme S subunit